MLSVVPFARARHLTRLLLFGVVLIALAASISGQQSPSAADQQAPATSPETTELLPSYEGQTVSSVELAGRPDLNPEQFLPLLAQREGQPFSREKIEATIAALRKTGQFKNVQLQLLPVPNGVRVLFVLEPAFYFGIYEFPGAERFSYARLLQVSDYPPQAGPYTQFDIRSAQQALEKFFQRNGYFLAQVRPEVQTVTVHRLVNVYFHVDLNRHASFGNVVIQGATQQETTHLRDALQSIWARLRGAAIRPGKAYKLKTVRNASNYLQKTLGKQQYLGAKVNLLGATYDPKTNRADVAFHVTTGPRVSVQAKSAFLWPWTKKKLIPLFQQAGYNPELVQEGRQDLLSYFQSKGYFNVKVETSIQKQPAEQTVLYQIMKGPRHEVETVSLAGNKHVSTAELMKYVTVKKAHFLTHGKYSETLVHTTVSNLTNIYRADGFSSVSVAPQVSTSGGDMAVVFRINEGPQDIVQSFRIEGNNTLSQTQMAPKGLKVVPGKPYSQKLVNEDQNRIMARYLDLGYLTANFHATATPVSGNKHRLDVVYDIFEGPQVRTGTVITLGRQLTKQQLINRNLAVRSGQPLREDQMLSSSTRLYNQGVFDWAQVDPRRHITTQTQEDVLVKVHESKRNVLTYGGGFEVINRGGSLPGGTVAVPGLPPVGLPSAFRTSEKTFWGPRGTFEYTRKNLRGKAESFTVAGLAGRLDQRGSIAYTDPAFFWSNWIASATLGGEHNSENPIFTSRQAQIGSQFQHALNPNHTQNFFLRYSYSQTGLTHLLIPDLVPPSDLHVRLSTISGTYIRDTRDNPLDAHKGIFETLEFNLTPSALGSSVDFAKLQGQTAYYKAIIPSIIWANSIRLGFEEPFAGSHVPLSEEFFTGGGSTLRGFPLDGAGPQRVIAACGSTGCFPITVPVGGNQLVILNSEFRFPDALKFLPLPFGVNKHLGFAVFYDGGNVFRTIGFHGQYTNSVGGGLRYSTPVGPIRIDIGHNLNAPPGIKSTQIFVTLGQAF